MSDEITFLYRMQRTLLQMLRDRHYLIAESELNATFETFREKWVPGAGREALTMLRAKRDNPADQIFVFFANDEKVGIKPIKEYVTRMEKEKVSRAILVLRKGITPFGRNIIKEMAAPTAGPARKIIELYDQEELLVNITEHTSVPKHQLLSDDEKQALLKRYKLREIQLPRIQQADPVARYYGLSRGQVVKITRPSETAGQYVAYRLVV